MFSSFSVIFILSAQKRAFNKKITNGTSKNVKKKLSPPEPAEYQ